LLHQSLLNQLLDPLPKYAKQTAFHRSQENVLIVANEMLEEPLPPLCPQI